MISLLELPYDYHSLMHYGSADFAQIRGQTTIETKDPE